MILLSLTASVLPRRWIMLRPLNASWRYPVKQQPRLSLRCEVMGTGTSFVPHSGTQVLKTHCPELYYFPNHGQELEMAVLKKRCYHTGLLVTRPRHVISARFYLLKHHLRINILISSCNNRVLSL